jgi:hypothetical protein
MYHTQQFQTAGFRSGQLRADSAQSFGSRAASQYKGMTPRFEPTGTVPSFYQPQKQSVSMQVPPREQPLKQIQHSSRQFQQPVRQFQQPVQQAWQPSQQNWQQQQPYGQTAASPTAFHTAAYRGNQPGHDQYLRADSTQPASSNAQAGSYRF